MHRFFITPESFEAQRVTLTGDQAHQVRRVLRLRAGDRVTLLDGSGLACEAELSVLGDQEAVFEVIRRWEGEGEPVVHVTVFQAVLKGERFGWALQKGTEVGVSAFVPLVCRRTVVEVSDFRDAAGRQERWERIIREAAEQSGRSRLPRLLPVQHFADAIRPSAGLKTNLLRLIPWEGERSLRLRDALSGCNLSGGARIELFIGPEGGFDADEIDLARQNAVRPVTLGPRILRSETAGVVAAALILYEAGDL